MTVLSVAFSGRIKKVREFTAQSKQCFDVSVCKKNYTKPGEADSYSWLNIKVFDVHEKMAPYFVAGNSISGVGELTLRSYEQEGVKKQTMECVVYRGAYTVDGAEATKPAPAAAATPVATKPAKEQSDDEPPF